MCSQVYKNMSANNKQIVIDIHCCLIPLFLLHPSVSQHEKQKYSSLVLSQVPILNLRFSKSSSNLQGLLPHSLFMKGSWSTI